MPFCPIDNHPSPLHTHAPSPFSLALSIWRGKEHIHEDKILLLYKSHQRTLVPSNVLVLVVLCCWHLSAHFEASFPGDLWLLFSLKKDTFTLLQVVKVCPMETLCKSGLQSQVPAVAMWPLGLLQAYREESLLSSVPSCSSCVLPIARKLNCHFIVAVFHTSDSYV